MIQTKQQLLELLTLIKDEFVLGLDTEFIRCRTYYPVLCLIQLSTTKAEYVIDVLAIKDLSPLFNKLYDEKTTWVVHSSGQDIEALFVLSKQVPSKIFDTQIAANLLNIPYQISYQALCDMLLSVTVDKTHTRFDWQKRPLPAAVIDYARIDVKYLLPIYQLLKQQLELSKKTLWMQEECQYLIDKNKPQDNHHTQWQKLKNIGKLLKEYYPQAQALSAWRESYAIEKNKPKQWIIKDELLINIASGKTQLNEKLAENFKQFLLNYQAKIPAIISQNRLSPSEQKIYKQYRQSIKEIAQQHQINPEAISNKKTLVSFVKGSKNTRLHQGWRLEILYHLLK